MKRIILSLLIIPLAIAVFAQKNEDHRKKFEQMKIAMITKQLDLSSESAQQFWPLYNEYQNQRKALGSKLASYRDAKGTDDMDHSSMLDEIFKKKEEELKLEKEFVQKLKTVISDKQILMLMRAEREFKSELLNGVRKRRGKMGNG